MPEHGEIRVLTQQVTPLVVGKRFVQVFKLDRKYESIIRDLDFLRGQVVTSVSQHGKKMYWHFPNSTVTFSFGMTGNFTQQQTTHSRIEFHFEDDSKIFFTDIRKFGSVKVEKAPVLSGIDPLTHKFTVNALTQLLKDNSKQRIGEYLLDQNGICGIGNYLRAEILYRAKISPWASCGSLNSQNIADLHRIIPEILNEAYLAGGATLATYRSLSGIGSFSSSFQVYKKTSDSLGNPVVRELDKTKRAMWWCPKVQQ